MNVRIAAAAAALALAALPLFGAAPAVPGLRGTGTLVVQANVQGAPLNIGGNVALYHKGTAYRLDLLSLGFPGASGDLSALAATLIGPGGVSMLYDAAAGTLTAWSNANRTYFTQTTAAAPSAATAAAVRSVPVQPADPLGTLATLAAGLHDIESATIQLVGHAPANGHPATNFDIQLRRHVAGRDLENYHAQLALADDLGDFPIQLALQSVPANKNAFGGTMKLDLKQLQPDSPDDAMFVVPAGYTRVDSLAGVLRLPGR